MGVVPVFARNPGASPRAGRSKRKRKQRNQKGRKTPRVIKCGTKLVRFDVEKAAAWMAAQKKPDAARPSPDLVRLLAGPPDLLVPTPAERVRPEDVTYPCRDGQSSFRALVLGVYAGRCAVTRCNILPLVEAAHIMPYVDERSNILANGLALRCDIHRLYDRNLIRISGDGKISIDESLSGSMYAKLDGRQFMLPPMLDVRPDPRLLDIREFFIA